MKNVYDFPQSFYFKKWLCICRRGFYVSHPHVPSLQLVGAPGTEYAGEPIATASVNLAGLGEPLEPGRVWVKSWGENKGMGKALQVAHIIGPVVGLVETGHVHASEHALIEPASNGN